MAYEGNTQLLTILAQDPGVRIGRRLVTARVPVPTETVALGPCGYRVKVVDFDASSNRLYKAMAYEHDEEVGVIDPFEPPAEKASAAEWRRYETRLLESPAFHCQNAYAIAMRTLARFEHALGRRVEWGFGGHQLHIAPHAFAEANAFYSEPDRALMFGYFRTSGGRRVCTSLSHDIVAHETTHAILDGIRDSFTEPSTPDQAAFHEGFADIVALLSVYSLTEVIAACLSGSRRRTSRRMSLVAASSLTREHLKESVLFGLWKQAGDELEGERGAVLRRSVKLKPSKNILLTAKYQEEHIRGEVLVAAVMNAFLDVWIARIEKLGRFQGEKVNLDMVVEEGARVASRLLNIAIRALDYCPPVDLTFPDYLAAMLTADSEVAPDDSKYGFRATLRKAFAGYGIDPPPATTDPSGQWKPFTTDVPLEYARINLDSMVRNTDEVFRFCWDNRAAFGIDERGYTRVSFVRPCIRRGPDGFVLRETVCEYVQQVDLFGAELGVFGLVRPEGMPTTQRVKMYGGATIVFDQFGHVKYHICHALGDAVRQQARLDYLWKAGLLERAVDARNHFAMLHQSRALSVEEGDR